MIRYRVLLAGLIVVGVAAFASARYLFPASAEHNRAPVVQALSVAAPSSAPLLTVQAQQSPPAAHDVEDAARKATQDYVKAFNAHDAKAAASLFTAEGEYVGPDGIAFNGRAAIEKSLADGFKENPKVNIEVKIDSVRLLSRNLVLTEGVVTEKNAGQEPGETRYRALQVLDDGVWRAASVSEWSPNPEIAASQRLLDWLVGDWTAKGVAGSINIQYSWNETHAFLTGKYAIARDGKTVSSGTEIMARDPNGGLRSWTFDSTGTLSTGQWQREGTRWIDEGVGSSPSGARIESVNLLIPIGPDAFIWQCSNRTVDGVPYPPLPPVKVTRAKAANTPEKNP